MQIEMKKLKFKSRREKQLINHLLIDFIENSKEEILSMDDLTDLLNWSNNLHLITNFNIKQYFNVIKKENFFLLLIEIGTKEDLELVKVLISNLIEIEEDLNIIWTTKYVMNNGISSNKLKVDLIYSSLSRFEL